MAQVLLGRARKPQMLVVVLVASDGARDEARTQLPEAVVLVDAPVNGEGLAATVRTFLGSNGRRRGALPASRLEAVL